MNLRDKLPADEIMREMSRMAIETATTSIAAQARELAERVPPQATGREALLAFANAIEATNRKRFHVEEKQS